MEAGNAAAVELPTDVLGAHRMAPGVQPNCFVEKRLSDFTIKPRRISPGGLSSCAL